MKSISNVVAIHLHSSTDLQVIWNTVSIHSHFSTELFYIKIRVK